MRKLPYLFIFTLIFCLPVFPQENQNSSCPTVELITSTGLTTVNQPVQYSARVNTKGRDLKIEYVWSVSGGRILEGHGTPSIKIEAPSSGMLNVGVKVKGFPVGCTDTTSETMARDAAPEAVKIDSFSDSISKSEKAKIEKVVKEIQNDPNALLYIIVGYKGKTLPKSKTRREREIDTLLVKEKGIDPNRIKWVRDFSDEALTQFWIVPAGANPPQINKK